MVTLAIVILIILLGLTAAVFLLGFRLGGEHWQSEVTKIRMEAARAERQLHDLTRQAFVAMTQHAERSERER
jgi:hypothetical protein